MLHAAFRRMLKTNASAVVLRVWGPRSRTRVWKLRGLQRMNFFGFRVQGVLFIGLGARVILSSAEQHKRCGRWYRQRGVVGWEHGHRLWLVRHDLSTTLPSTTCRSRTYTRHLEVITFLHSTVETSKLQTSQWYRHPQPSENATLIRSPSTKTCTKSLRLTGTLQAS